MELRVEHVGGAKDAPQTLGPNSDFVFFDGSETSVLQVALKNKRQVLGSFSLELWRLPLQRDIKLTVGEAVALYSFWLKTVFFARFFAVPCGVASSERITCRRNTRC